MEQTNASGLTGLLMRYVLRCAAGVCAVLLFGAMAFVAAFSRGFIVPANAAEQAARQAVERMEARGVFFAGDVPQAQCDYLLLDEIGRIAATSLADQALNDALYYGQTGTNRNGRYHMTAKLNHGSCILQYRIRAEYANTRLRGLPDFSLLTVGVLAVLLALALYLPTRAMTRRCKRGLEPLSKAAQRLVAGDLETPLAHSDIREYDAALDSMRLLQTSLKESLNQQWKLEHNRVLEMDALAHDLRTPLTVIDGNAQLLDETPLNKEQRAMLESILQGSRAALEYVGELRELVRVSAPQDTQNTRLVDGDALTGRIRVDADGLCRMRGLELQFFVEALPQLYLEENQVLRAVGNLVQNAVEHTPSGGAVACEITRDKDGVSITVTDGGSGFSAEALLHGREWFFTGEAGRTPQGHLGLGLAFADTVAARYHGALVLENTMEGHGRARLTLNGVCQSEAGEA